MKEDPKREAHARLVSRLLEGAGRSSPQDRRRAFDNAWTGEPLQSLLGKVANDPARITDADVRRVQAAGVPEDEIFELVVCAAVGTATRQYEAGLDALTTAVGDATGSDDAP
jgi:hypothetical protein